MTTEVTSYAISSDTKNQMRKLVKDGKFRSLNAIVVAGIKKIIQEQEGKP